MVRETAVAPRPVGILTIVGIFLLFTVIVITVALFFYKGIMEKRLVTMQNNLTLAENRFEPAKIKELQILDKRLNASNEILSKHIAVTPIFEALSATTMKSVRFTKFGYDVAEDGSISIKMSGVTLGYSNLALQSDLFSQNKNFINPVFSNLSLNEQGNVAFDLVFSVDPSFVGYKVKVQTESGGNNFPVMPEENTGGLNNLNNIITPPEAPGVQ